MQGNISLEGVIREVVLFLYFKKNGLHTLSDLNNERCFCYVAVFFASRATSADHRMQSSPTSVALVRDQDQLTEKEKLKLKLSI